jgi:hypothetical protein
MAVPDRSHEELSHRDSTQGDGAGMGGVRSNRASSDVSKEWVSRAQMPRGPIGEGSVTSACLTSWEEKDPRPRQVQWEGAWQSWGGFSRAQAGE